LCRRALLDHPAVHHAGDAVGRGHRAEAVGDHEDGPALAQPPDRLHDRGLRREVELCGGLVEDEDRRVLEPGPGEGETLGLATGQTLAPLAKHPLLPVATRKPSRLTIACASVTHRARVRTRLSRTVSNARTWHCSSEVRCAGRYAPSRQASASACASRLSVFTRRLRCRLARTSSERQRAAERRGDDAPLAIRRSSCSGTGEGPAPNRDDAAE
jgi:hypothetical protein